MQLLCPYFRMPFRHRSLPTGSTCTNGSQLPRGPRKHSHHPRSALRRIFEYGFRQTLNNIFLRVHIQAKEDKVNSDCSGDLGERPESYHLTRLNINVVKQNRMISFFAAIEQKRHALSLAIPFIAGCLHYFGCTFTVHSRITARKTKQKARIKIHMITMIHYSTRKSVGHLGDQCLNNNSKPHLQGPQTIWQNFPMEATYG